MDDAPAPLDALPAECAAPAAGTNRDLSQPVDVLPAEMPAAITETERIASIDVLRGLAVLGILVMNIQSFSMIEAAYANPTAFGNLEGANYSVWLISHLLADQKFMTIFAMLFGAGIVLMTSRRDKAGLTSAAVHYRRMAALALFGLLHTYLLWYGDILFSYALCGMVVYPFRRLRPWLQLLLGSLCIVVPSMFLLSLGLVLPWLASSPQVSEQVHSEIERGLRQSWQPSPEAVEAELAAYRGSWHEGFQKRWPTALGMEIFGFLFMTAWRAGGLMLVGMALFKLGLFSATRSPWTYLALVAAAFFVAVPIILYGVERDVAANWDMFYSMFWGSQFNYWGSIVVSLGWVGLVMLAYQQSRLRPVMRPLAAVGRMAFTNYLLQTLLCTTIFYGHGLGLFGRVERVGQIGIVFGVWAFQLIVAPVWLHFFHFGPAEWLWRCLTYLKWPTLRRRHPVLRSNLASTGYGTN